MKTIALTVLKLLGALFVFVGILAGCVTALALVILMLRFPVLLVAVLLTCWIFSRIQSKSQTRAGE
ncbi:hypothetical protein [Pseudomonas peli]|uniref:hypothetical protein n=1 Tax=Pseudomonas peli TaxID=592361 RepID=UPI003D311616